MVFGLLPQLPKIVEPKLIKFRHYFIGCQNLYWPSQTIFCRNKMALNLNKNGGYCSDSSRVTAARPGRSRQFLGRLGPNRRAELGPLVWHSPLMARTPCPSHASPPLWPYMKGCACAQGSNPKPPSKASQPPQSHLLPATRIHQVLVEFPARCCGNLRLQLR